MLMFVGNKTKGCGIHPDLVHNKTLVLGYSDIKHRFVGLKGMEHVPNILMSYDKYLFLEVINILI